MSQHEGQPPSADWVAQDLEQMVREDDELMESQDEQLRRLRASIADIETQREHTFQHRTSAWRALENLRTAVLEGQQLRTAQNQSPGPHLRVVPEAEDPPAPTTDDRTDTPEPEQLPPGNPVVRIGGERSLTLLKVISAGSKRDWSVRAVTEALGESSDAIRRNRCVLDTLCKRGVLAKKEKPNSEGNGMSVYYRLVAPWQAA